MGAKLSRRRSREQLVAAPAQGAPEMSSSTSLAADESRVVAAPSTTNRFFRRGGRPLVLAHRGMWQAAQENTVDAIRLALESEADGVEIDVQMTKDGHLVLFHDDTLERCTGVHGFIPDMTLAELQQLNYITEISQPSRHGVVTFTYDKPRPIALLEDVLKIFAEYGGRKVIDVEIKASRPMWSRRHWGTAVAQLLKKYNAADWVVVTSFDFIMLYYAAREYPQLRTGFAYDDDIAVGLDECAREWFEKVPTIRNGRLEPPASIKNGGGLLRWLMEANVIGWAFNCSAAIFEWTVLDSDTVEKFRHRDYAVGTYTIFALDKSFSHFDLTDSETHILIRNLLAQRVDWIETDEPAKLLALIKQVEQETMSSAAAESAAASTATPVVAATGHADKSGTLQVSEHSAAVPDESSKQPASSDDVAAANDAASVTAATDGDAAALD